MRLFPRLWLFLTVLILGCGEELPTPPGSGSVARTVLAELFTATWCPSCPEAQAALERLSAELGPDSLVVLAYHPQGADPFGIPEADERASAYGVRGLPTLILDGTERVVGAAGDLYERYHELVRARLAQPGPIRIDAITHPPERGEVLVELSLKVVDPLPEDQLILQFAVLEDSLYYLGSKIYRFVVREMVPDASGERFELGEGGSLRVLRRFRLEDGNRVSWVAFLQSPTDHSVVQAVQGFVTSPGYNFSLVVPDTTDTTRLGERVEFPFSLINLGGSPDSLVIDIPDSTRYIPKPWTVLLCDDTLCYPFPAAVGCRPGDTLRFKLEVAPLDSLGQGRFQILVRSRSAPGLVRAQWLFVEAIR